MCEHGPEDAALVGLLLDEAHAAAEHERWALGQAFAAIAVAVALVTGLPALAAGNDVRPVLLAAPPAGLCVWHVALRALAEAYAAAGRRARLEQEIRRVTAVFVPWDQVAGRGVVTSWPNVAAFAALVLGTLVFSVVALAAASPRDASWWIAVTSTTALSLSAGVAGWQAVSLFRKVRSGEEGRAEGAPAQGGTWSTGRRGA